MAINTQFNDVFSSTIESVKLVIPCPLIIGDQSKITEQLYQFSMGVQIGFTGDISGQLIIAGNNGIFEKIGERMFGYHLSGDMLKSFTGELGNMIAGHFSTYISKNGVMIDIIPPTVLVGETKIPYLKKNFFVPVKAEGLGELQILLTAEN